jgi:hypothetical protein
MLATATPCEALHHLTSRELQERFGCTWLTIHRWVKAGKLPRPCCAINGRNAWDANAVLYAEQKMKAVPLRQLPATKGGADGALYGRRVRKEMLELRSAAADVLTLAGPAKVAEVLQRRGFVRLADVPVPQRARLTEELRKLMAVHSPAGRVTP